MKQFYDQDIHFVASEEEFQNMRFALDSVIEVMGCMDMRTAPESKQKLYKDLVKLYEDITKILESLPF